MMNIDTSPITNSPQYPVDLAKLPINGKKLAKKIYLIIALVVIPLLWPVLAFYWYTWHKKYVREQALRQAAIAEFVSKNGFSFEDRMGKWLKSASGVLMSGEYDLPFNVVEVLAISEMRGTANSFPFTYLLASVATPSHDTQPARYPMIIFSIDLPVNLPRVFMNSKHNNMPGLNAAATNFTDSEDHRLEGDFPDYYTVRAEKNERIDMYQILTPEVMQALKQHDLYDVWINGSKLVLISGVATVDHYFAGIPAVFKNAQLLMDEIDVIARALR
jgi:hypothetical protein